MIAAIREFLKQFLRRFHYRWWIVGRWTQDGKPVESASGPYDYGVARRAMQFLPPGIYGNLITWSVEYR